MSWFALPRLGPALLVLGLAGCSGSVDDGTGTSEGASTVAPAASAPAQPTMAGNYSGRMHGEWDGSLAITNASAEKLDFAFEISPDVDVTNQIGRIDGTAKVQAGGHYVYTDGSCTIEFEPALDPTAAKRGDLFIDADLSCAIGLGIDGHTRGATALDFTATWHRD